MVVAGGIFDILKMIEDSGMEMLAMSWSEKMQDSFTRVAFIALASGCYS